MFGAAVTGVPARDEAGWDGTGLLRAVVNAENRQQASRTHCCHVTRPHRRLRETVVPSVARCSCCCFVTLLFLTHASNNAALMAGEMVTDGRR